MHIHRILRLGGVALVTVPAISRVAPRYGLTRDYWRFTQASCKVLFEEVFGPGHAAVYPYGNVLTAVAFLVGMAREELSVRELDALDEYYPVIVAIRAVKNSRSPSFPS